LANVPEGLTTSNTLMALMMEAVCTSGMLVNFYETSAITQKTANFILAAVRM
jgi:hypothetical protein